jgi:hypothetical protein
MDNNKDSKVISGGWTLKNFLIGGVLFVLGCLFYVLDAYAAYLYIGDSTRSLPWFINLLQYVAIFVVLVGVSGFWVIVPAFQKWWCTRRWLAWTFFLIGLIVPYLLLASLVSELFSMKS